MCGVLLCITCVNHAPPKHVLNTCNVHVLHMSHRCIDYTYISYMVKYRYMYNICSKYMCSTMFYICNTTKTTHMYYRIGTIGHPYIRFTILCFTTNKTESSLFMKISPYLFLHVSHLRNHVALNSCFQYIILIVFTNILSHENVWHIRNEILYLT